MTDYDESTNTSVQATENYNVYEIGIRVPLGEFGMRIGLELGKASFI